MRPPKQTPFDAIAEKITKAVEPLKLYDDAETKLVHALLKIIKAQGEPVLSLPEGFFDFEKSCRIICRQYKITPEKFQKKPVSYAKDFFEIYDIGLKNIRFKDIAQKRQ
jgi:hypothetical protein